MVNQFTLYVPDRRGRAMSGPCDKDHGLDDEVEDLEALLSETGARYVFGLSAGAVIALEAALRIRSITKLALYEPPLETKTMTQRAWVPRYERELARGDLAAALVTVLKGTADKTALRFVPRALLKQGIRLGIRAVIANLRLPVPSTLWTSSRPSITTPSSWPRRPDRSSDSHRSVATCSFSVASATTRASKPRSMDSPRCCRVRGGSRFPGSGTPQPTTLASRSSWRRSFGASSATRTARQSGQAPVTPPDQPSPIRQRSQQSWAHDGPLEGSRFQAGPP